MRDGAIFSIYYFHKYLAFFLVNIANTENAYLRCIVLLWRNGSKSGIIYTDGKSTAGSCRPSYEEYVM